MAGDWLKMEHSLPDKPEVLAISSAMGVEPDAVVGKCFRVWRWFDQHTKNGHAPNVTSVTLLSVIGHGNNNAAFIEQLKRVKWLLEDETGMSLPNFDRHNGETAKTRGLAGKRKQKQRAKSHDGVTDMSRNERDESVTREEKRREDIKEREGGVAEQQSEPVTAVSLSIAFRKSGVQTQPQDPRLIELVNQGVTPETVTAACEAAKDAKPNQRISLGYVVAILQDWAQRAKELEVAGAQQPKKSGGAWWKSYETKLAKAIEVGVGEPLRGEPMDAWEARIQTAIDNGGKPPENKQKSVATPISAAPVRVDMSPEAIAARKAEIQKALEASAAATRAAQERKAAA